MKFLVDRCAGKRLADWLRGEGHDVLEARTLGPDPGASIPTPRFEHPERIYRC
jgi:predicted nuclease of predicted toxin-antitoxin system